MKRLVLSGLCALFLATPAQAERLRMPIEWVADGDTLATRKMPDEAKEYDAEGCILFLGPYEK
jgi:hypothetical protein